MNLLLQKHRFKERYTSKTLFSKNVCFKNSRILISYIYPINHIILLYKSEKIAAI